MAKYSFNVGDEVTWRLRGPSETTTETHRITKVLGRWCWLDDSDKEWNCFDRDSGLPKESPIPGFVATIHKPLAKGGGA